MNQIFLQAHISKKPPKGILGVCWGLQPQLSTLPYKIKKSKKNLKKSKKHFLHSYSTLASPLPLLYFFYLWF
jgi:hypothetical protein